MGTCCIWAPIGLNDRLGQGFRWPSHLLRSVENWFVGGRRILGAFCKKVRDGRNEGFGGILYGETRFPQTLSRSLFGHLFVNYIPKIYRITEKVFHWKIRGMQFQYFPDLGDPGYFSFWGAGFWQFWVPQEIYGSKDAKSRLLDDPRIGLALEQTSMALRGKLALCQVLTRALPVFLLRGPAGVLPIVNRFS